VIKNIYRYGGGPTDGSKQKRECELGHPYRLDSYTDAGREEPPKGTEEV